MRKTQAQCFFCLLTSPSDLWYLLKPASLLLGNPIRLHLFLGCSKGVIHFQNAKPSPGYPNGLSALENIGENGPVGISDLIAIPAQQHPKIYKEHFGIGGERSKVAEDGFDSSALWL